ncbi:DUF3500 domain-containing protein [Streptomyces cylindrosporus]|uniref:DUF3500 domain-containing protein n=1 Tax=Streptomyces cylindrosporus TaxID=2927583 RepID=A0ABS9YLA5_9ACTN|nr:DUF3500 domain-containing protein [Streptomyces cylindrosporus]MCI3277959.1 DUF3500 domain-containing protein [Streptomyces cylindrosporus]
MADSETNGNREADRRGFMRRVFLAGGATAFTAMGGAGALAFADDGSTPSATPTDSASPSPSASPTRAPGGGGPGAQTITEDFFGLTTDGRRLDDLFTIHSQGVDTAPVVAAANAFLAGLTDTQKTATQFTLRSTEWRTWSNLDPGEFPRKGVSFADLTADQNVLGTALLKAALSADGLETTEKIRRINNAAGELLGKSDDFNDVLFYWTVMGTPSTTEPWGFQLDGHHLVVNYFVLGDQVVMSPCFWGSEPTSMEIDGETVSVCQEEVAASLAFIQSLTAAQQQTAIVSATKADEDMKAGAFADNAVEAYAGIRATALTAAQRKKLLAVAEAFVDRAKADVARARMAEIRAHLDDTYAAWIGGTGDDDPFYLRVHSPVVWIEVDCQAAGPLGGAYGKTRADGPSQLHIHSVVRTPNGNDYGSELLRQHYLTSPHHR